MAFLTNIVVGSKLGRFAIDICRYDVLLFCLKMLRYRWMMVSMLDCGIPRRCA